jgi:tyrosyl-tRNA synthetase
MSKSLNNHIGITEPPCEMYGKVMSIPDCLIGDYFDLVTDVADAEVAGFREQLRTRSANPMNLKKRLAYEIVGQFHGREAAEDAAGALCAGIPAEGDSRGDAHGGGEGGFAWCRPHGRSRRGCYT